ncbi:uncharacterized protein SPPG_00546 [Spizellomyces punctatus DAOM BR117]|uniref:Uncharacterized protein n=1 Tax=Spizellomyces punctatus (strain DAOM BR117) TaxID=645134 RepID=A0A0L0HU10_SPIPD|nr:uncharacterized protein SPPG_00546 [Spizellomyces punctatus DAOM BR117]KND04846.1 hypothetical protein SPPG_00546 [Spizellomyces punctatus DAOM BR117]|eukprot:XP_016612885.1 hypothetical protein SPPG_00546 [Spizellomyces punctatus DAOM BR117]
MEDVTVIDESIPQTQYQDSADNVGKGIKEPCPERRRTVQRRKLSSGRVRACERRTFTQRPKPPAEVDKDSPPPLPPPLLPHLLSQGQPSPSRSSTSLHLPMFRLATKTTSTDTVTRANLQGSSSSPQNGINLYKQSRLSHNAIPTRSSIPSEGERAHEVPSAKSPKAGQSLKQRSETRSAMPQTMIKCTSVNATIAFPTKMRNPLLQRLIKNPAASPVATKKPDPPKGKSGLCEDFVRRAPLSPARPNCPGNPSSITAPVTPVYRKTKLMGLALDEASDDKRQPKRKRLELWQAGTNSTRKEKATFRLF